MRHLYWDISTDIELHCINTACTSGPAASDSCSTFLPSQSFFSGQLGEKEELWGVQVESGRGFKRGADMKINVDFFAERPDKKIHLSQVWKTPKWRRLVPEGVLHVNWDPFRPQRSHLQFIFYQNNIFIAFLQRWGPHLHPQSKNKDIGVYLASILWRIGKVVLLW